MHLRLEQECIGLRERALRLAEKAVCINEKEDYWNYD
jgi:hypothetical protein